MIEIAVIARNRRNRRNRKIWQRARLARRAACIRRQRMIAYVEVLSGLERSDKEK